MSKKAKEEQLVSSSLRDYIGERQRAFTKQIKKRAEAEGVRLDVKISIQAFPLNSDREVSKNGRS